MTCSFANLVDEHGPKATLNALDRLVREFDAQVTVFTAHSAKGREWLWVRIAPDRTPPPDTDERAATGLPAPRPVDEAEARLADVAVTRAGRHLDLSGWHGSQTTRTKPDGSAPERRPTGCRISPEDKPAITR
ncbi:P-loop NTPase family protein [Streptomyces microflavus]|uniref:hypothetical protein n=1 Tax=Streptomyces microflavus TaxID=1919 RepID=UPI003656B5F7